MSPSLNRFAPALLLLSQQPFNRKSCRLPLRFYLFICVLRECSTFVILGSHGKSVHFPRGRADSRRSISSLRGYEVAQLCAPSRCHRSRFLFAAHCRSVSLQRSGTRSGTKFALPLRVRSSKLSSLFYSRFGI